MATVEYYQTGSQQMWTTTNGYRAEQTYIDEMVDRWRDRLNDEIRQHIYEELTYSSTRTAEATFTADTTFFNQELLRNMMGDWTATPPTVAKVDAEPEDVNPDDFEKILNGG